MAFPSGLTLGVRGSASFVLGGALSVGTGWGSWDLVSGDEARGPDHEACNKIYSMP